MRRIAEGGYFQSRYACPFDELPTDPTALRVLALRRAPVAWGAHNRSLSDDAGFAGGELIGRGALLLANDANRWVSMVQDHG
jgi:hypothetical protein